MKKAVPTIISILVTTVVVLAGKGTIITIEAPGDGRLVGVEKTKLEFEGATLWEKTKSQNWMIGYIDGSIKKIEIGSWEVIETYSTSYAPDGIYDEVADNDGCRYIACFAHDGNDNDMGTIKFNASGEIEWVRTFNSGGRDISNSICVDDEGNVYTSGFTYLGKDDGVRVIKYDSQGLMVWIVIYDEEGYDKPNGLSFDDEGNIRVKCLSKGEGIHTITYDPNGNRI